METKNGKNGPKQHNKVFFAQMAKKASAEGRSPPQELEEGPRSGLYLLVPIKGKLLMVVSKLLQPRHTNQGFGSFLAPLQL